VGHDLAYGWSHYQRSMRPSGNSAAVNAGEMARQNTGSADLAGHDDEDVPDLEATGPAGPGVLEEAPPPPEAPPEVPLLVGGEPGNLGRGGNPGPSEGDTPEPGDAQEASGLTGDIASLVSEVDSLQREAVPF
jgi:hypothetical protein